MAKLNAYMLDVLTRMAEGITAVVGPDCEVVIYDFDDLEHAVVAVIGDVTGRKAEAPVPDLHFITEALNPDVPDRLNYRTRLGERKLQSSLIWIRDDEDVPIGAIGINIDYTDLIQARNHLDKMTSSLQNVTDSLAGDTFAKNLEDLIDISVNEFLLQENLPNVEALGQDDKRRLIQVVEDSGLFKVRGAVNYIADLLNVSRATVYNYRSNLKN